MTDETKATLKNAETFRAYLLQTLIPSLRDAGYNGTANDVQASSDFIATLCHIIAETEEHHRRYAQKAQMLYQPLNDDRSADMVDPIMDFPYQFTVQTSVTITAEQIDDIMETALEGGISYWCTSALPLNNDYKGATYASHAVSKGATLCLVDGESETQHDLDAVKLIEGIKTACKLHPEYLPMFSDPEEHSHNLDAERADVIIQCAIFGETIYG